MKNKTWAMILGAVLLVCIGLSLWLLLPGKAATHARILSDGKVIQTVDLRLDQEITVLSPTGGTNTVTVRSGRIAVTNADCPDHYCMHRGFCDSGTAIVCLPNRLVIEFVGEAEIDGAVG